MLLRPSRRHAAPRPRTRPLLINALFVSLAAAILILPVSGGIAHGPQLVIAGVFAGLVFRHRKGWSNALALTSAGCTVLAMAAWSSAWDRFVATGDTAWGNTAVGWIVAAATSGLTAARLRSAHLTERERRLERELQQVRAELRRLSNALGA